jgi:hypothetical protein
MATMLSTDKSHQLQESFLSDTSEEPPSRFTWMKSIYFLSESETYHDAGYEVVLYLKFLKYSCVMYTITFIFGGIPLLVTYVRDSYRDEQTVVFNSFLERMTIKSYQGIQRGGSYTIWMLFLFYVVFVVMGHTQLYLFE